MPGAQLQTAAQAQRGSQQHAVCQRHAQRLVICTAGKDHGGFIAWSGGGHFGVLHELLRGAQFADGVPGFQFPRTLFGQFGIQIDEVSAGRPGKLALFVGEAGVRDKARQPGLLHHVLQLFFQRQLGRKF